jgi:hypothetical protein
MSGSPIIQKRPENSEAKEVKVIPFFSSAMRKISRKNSSRERTKNEPAQASKF